MRPALGVRTLDEQRRSLASQEMTGPTSVPSSSPLPTFSFFDSSTSFGITLSWAEPTVTITEPAMQRWPAAPKPEPIRPLTVGSTTASGQITMWFLAPPRA